MHIHRQQPLSAGLFRGGEKTASAHSSSLMRLLEYHSKNGVCSITQLGDWALCIVFSQDFKITSTMYLTETTNSDSQNDWSASLSHKVHLITSLHRKIHKDWCLPAKFLLEQYCITLFDKLTVLTSRSVFHNEVSYSGLFNQCKYCILYCRIQRTEGMQGT